MRACVLVCIVLHCVVCARFNEVVNWSPQFRESLGQGHKTAEQTTLVGQWSPVLYQPQAPPAMLTHPIPKSVCLTRRSGDVLPKIHRYN